MQTLTNTYVYHVCVCVYIHEKGIGKPKNQNKIKQIHSDEFITIALGM